MGRLRERAARLAHALVGPDPGSARQGFTALKIEEYDTDWTSKAYYTVSGQNSNNSVRVTSEFMESVVRDRPWQTRAVTSGQIVDTHRARDLWRMIAEAAHQCGDPDAGALNDPVARSPAIGRCVQPRGAAVVRRRAEAHTHRSCQPRERHLRIPAAKRSRIGQRDETAPWARVDRHGQERRLGVPRSRLRGVEARFALHAKYACICVSSDVLWRPPIVPCPARIHRLQHVR